MKTLILSCSTGEGHNSCAKAIKEYYDSKRAEGRTHYNALGHCAGKLVRVIYKMLTDNVEFNLD